MAAPFPETHWSRLAELGKRSEAERLQTLRWFARHYWQPVYDYVRALRRGAPQEAEDLTQQFFANLLERDDLAALTPARGTVRGFLKTALRHFLANADRAVRARPPLVPLDETRDAAPVDPSLSPEEAFDRTWTRRVLAEALAHLRRQLEAEDRGEQLAMFEAYCLDDDEAVTYEEVGRRFGMKPEDVRNRVRDARRRMIEIVRGVVAEYLEPGQSVDDEVAFILGG
jgi:RNA polymerase sigma-70 factor (ECF subfamily)